MKDITGKKHKHLISWIVFLPTLFVVVVTLIPAIFPALLLRVFGGLEDYALVEPFEIGVWGWPILAANFIVFSLMTLHFKSRLPEIIFRPIRFLFNFEVSSYVAFVTIVIFVGLYTILSIGELFDGKFDADYYNTAKPWLESFDFFKLPAGELNRDVGHHLQIFFEVISMQAFGNYKVIPFIASIALPIMIYFLTVEITKKRFAGIISMIIVLQSSLFLFYDTSVSYPNFWILLYLLSLYLVYKLWHLSAVSFVIASLTKGLTAIFFPVTIFFIVRTSLSKKRKLYLMASYFGIVILGASFLAVTSSSLNPLDEKPFNSHNFVSGFNAFSIAFLDDGLILLFFLPLIVGLFFISRKGIVHADSIMLLIIFMLLSAPLLTGFSDHQNVPYRFVPIVTFFAIGAGLLFSRPIMQIEESSSKH